MLEAWRREEQKEVFLGKDKKQLEEKGVKGNFGPGTPLEAIIEFIHNNIKK